jgi:hypothetical protein
MAATCGRRPQRSRQLVDFKHEGGVWLAKEPFVETPNGAKPGYPIRQAGIAPPLARPPLASDDGLVAPLSAAALVLQRIAPAPCHYPGRLEFRQ